MSKIREALAELSNGGFVIADNNIGAELTSDAARQLYARYADQYDLYILGSVPASNESLANVDFDICFDEIERFANSGYLPGSGEVYDQLHEFANVSDVDVFIERVADYMKTVGEENVESALIDLIESVDDQKNLILEELNETIADLAKYA